MLLLQLQNFEAPAQPGEGVFHQGSPVGSVTSAAWGYRTNRNLAMAYVNPGLAVLDTELELLILGETVKARVCEPCLYDSANRIPRGIPAG